MWYFVWADLIVKAKIITSLLFVRHVFRMEKYFQPVRHHSSFREKAVDEATESIQVLDDDIVKILPDCPEKKLYEKRRHSVVERSLMRKHPRQ